MERQEAIDLKNHNCWKAFEAEINRMVAFAIEAMVKEKDPAEVVRLQERIKVIREIAALPDNIAEREE